MKRYRFPMFITACVALVVGSIWFFSGYISAGKEFIHDAESLRGERVAAKSEGLPMKPDDLRSRKVPDSLNAARFFERITSTMVRPLGEQNWPYDDVMAGRANSDQIAKTREVLKQHAVQIALAEQAVRLPFLDFHRKWEEGPELKLPEFGPARAVARMLGARAVMEDPLVGLDDVITVATVGHQMSQDPDMIGMLVGIAIETIADRSWLTIVRLHSRDARVLAAARIASDKIAYKPDVLSAMRGEFVLARLCVPLARKEVAPQLSGNRSKAIALENAYMDAVEARMIHYWRGIFRDIRTNPGDLLTASRAWKSKEDEMLASEGKLGHELEGVLEPAFAQVCLKALQPAAHAALRLGVLSLLEYHNRTGHFPERLYEVSDAQKLIDPFTNRPLLYRQTPTGFLLYSVGGNLVDDGGQVGPKTPLDIVVAYP